MYHCAKYVFSIRICNMHDMQGNDPGRQKNLEWQFENFTGMTECKIWRRKKSWATFCRRLIPSKNCQVWQKCSRTIISNFCNKTTQSSKKMIQNNLQIMIMAMLNGMMIFDFIVQFILFYCQYLHIRPCFHNVTTMRFKHSILFLRPPISPQNPGKTVTTKEKGSSSNLSYGILIHPISQTLPKRSKLLNSGFILQTRSKAFTVHTSASLIFQ